MFRAIFALFISSLAGFPGDIFGDLFGGLFGGGFGGFGGARSSRNRRQRGEDTYHPLR